MYAIALVTIAALLVGKHLWYRRRMSTGKQPDAISITTATPCSDATWSAPSMSSASSEAESVDFAPQRPPQGQPWPAIPEAPHDWRRHGVRLMAEFLWDIMPSSQGTASSAYDVTLIRSKREFAEEVWQARRRQLRELAITLRDLKPAGGELKTTPYRAHVALVARLHALVHTDEVPLLVLQVGVLMQRCVACGITLTPDTLPGVTLTCTLLAHKMHDDLPWMTGHVAAVMCVKQRVLLEAERKLFGILIDGGRGALVTEDEVSRVARSAVHGARERASAAKCS